MAATSLGSLAIYIYMKDVACVLRIERGIKAAITTIILSMTTKIFMVDSKYWISNKQTNQ